MFENWGKSPKEIELEQLIKQYEDEYQRSILAPGTGDLSKKALADQMRARLKGAKQETAQYLFKQAAGPGMSMTGVSHGGRGMPYGDTAMFNPKTMPPRYISGTRPREEDEPPGLATFSPYRMYS
jgi:hypothetical protein